MAQANGYPEMTGAVDVSYTSAALRKVAEGGAAVSGPAPMPAAPVVGVVPGQSAPAPAEPVQDPDESHASAPPRPKEEKKKEESKLEVKKDGATPEREKGRSKA